jgi:hypothetical protein
VVAADAERHIQSDFTRRVVALLAVGSQRFGFQKSFLHFLFFLEFQDRRDSVLSEKKDGLTRASRHHASDPAFFFWGGGGWDPAD